MMARAASLMLLAGVLLTLAGAHAAPPRPTDLATRIDRRLEARFKGDAIHPAPRAEDAEFLRRASLDLIGRIPRTADVHEFLADSSADKRARLIDELLEEPRFAVHFANLWRADLLPETSSSGQAALFQTGFQSWLIERFRANVPYDQMVRELLTAPVGGGREGEPVLRDPERPNPLAFFAVKEASPEKLAATVGRSFLGIRLECAQCHDHPFAKWTQEQFWSQSAFFAGFGKRGGLFAPLTEVADRRELRMLGNGKHIQPGFLDGGKPKLTPGQSSRVALAEWVTAPSNPYFARAAVNKLWAHFFGVGLVNPVDDFRDDNKPSDPALLDDLAAAFVASGFDLSLLIRGICRSEAYQRTSARTHPSQDGTRLPARMTVKALTGEQFFDSLALATGYRDTQDKGAARRQFLTRFAQIGPPAEPETSVPQALTLLNGRFVAWATDPQRCPTLIAVTQTPGLTRAGRIEALYLATLGRRPTPVERERLDRHVARADAGGEAERLADVFWALLNCAEFRLNH
ncbi:MAG TPA: DUF1549 and DUF1553 domain-containing protein [Gemmataceae bacterium]|nr:DUF1549 and DUF1553 domain-containing protein [Gemmataceae bacterium]